MLTELAAVQDRVVSSRGRQTPRGVKRKMTKYHLRPRGHWPVHRIRMSIFVQRPK
jgi:hypothetical protein